MHQAAQVGSENETKHFVADGMQQMRSHPINCLSSRSTTQPKMF